MTTSDAHKNSGIGKDMIVYVCLLALAGLQFVIAYQNLDPAQMLTRMLAVAFVEAGLAGVFFMHLCGVCSGFHDLCSADDAIWLDRQHTYGSRRSIFEMTTNWWLVNDDRRQTID